MVPARGTFAEIFLIVITWFKLVITNIRESQYFHAEMQPLTLTPRDMNEKFIITGKECAEFRRYIGRCTGTKG